MNSSNDAESFDLSIDEHRLDREWVDQPRRYFRYAERLAAAQRDEAVAKNALEVIRADWDRAIRANPGGFGLAKLTEDGVKATIVAQQEYINAQRVCIDVAYRCNVLTAAVRAMDHRKASLENLVKLALANYYAPPRADADDREAIDEMEKTIIRGRGIRENTA